MARDDKACGAPPRRHDARGTSSGVRAMSESSADRAAMWDERYAGADFAYGETANAYLKSQRARLSPGMRALVPGDGEGRNGVWLAEQGLIVDTLDLSAHGVAKARRLAAARGVALNAVQADALRWDWPREAYDVVALIFLHLAADERRALHAKVLGALKPGGLRHSRSVPARTDRARRRRARAAARATRGCSIASRTLRADFAGAGRDRTRRGGRESRARARCTSARASSSGRSCGAA